MVSAELDAFVADVSERAVEWREHPFTLRSGEQSHWYVELRAAHELNFTLAAACRLLLARADEAAYDFDTVLGNGVLGRLLAMGVVAVAPSVRKLEWRIANDNRADTDPQNGYGIHGGEVAGRRMLVVDDIGSSGDSLLTVGRMAVNRGGILVGAVNVADRSNGSVGPRLKQELGISYTALCVFDEPLGRLVPSPYDDWISSAG